MSRYLVALRAVNAVVIVVCIASIITGGLGLYFASDDAGWPAQSGVGIWCGAGCLIMAILGVVASSAFPDPSKDCKGFKRIMIALSVFCYVSLSLAGQDMGHSIGTIMKCTGGEMEAFCSENLVGVISMAAANATLGTILFVLTVSNLVLYHCAWRELRCCGQIQPTKA